MVFTYFTLHAITFTKTKYYYLVYYRKWFNMECEEEQSSCCLLVQNLLDQLRELKKEAKMQIYYIGFYEEPEREEMKKLAIGLREVGESNLR